MPPSVRRTRTKTTMNATKATVKTLLGIYDVCKGVLSEYDAFDQFYKGGGEKMFSDFEKTLEALGVTFVKLNYTAMRYERTDPTTEKKTGMFACRVGESRKMHYAFVREYLSRMEAAGWKHPDSSRISDALKHIINSFKDWRERKTAKPPEERDGEFGEDGFPADAGVFEPFLELADDCVSYLMDGGAQGYRHCVDLYAKLAFRGLVWDVDHLRELPTSRERAR